MNTTETTDTTVVPTDSAVTIMLRGADLARILHNASLAADAGRSALPVLAAVRLELDGDTLTAVATERHRLFVDTATCKAPQADTTAAALIRATDAVTVAKLAKGAAEVFVTFAASAVTVQTPNGSTTLTQVEGEFPRWRSLMPAADVATEITTAFALNPQQLAPLAKVETGRRGKAEAMTVRAPSASKAFRIEIGDTFVALIMPVRLR